MAELVVQGIKAAGAEALVTAANVADYDQVKAIWGLMRRAEEADRW